MLRKIWCRGGSEATAAPSMRSDSLAGGTSVARCIRRFRSWRRCTSSSWTRQTSRGRWKSWRTTQSWYISSCATPVLRAGWKTCPTPSVCTNSISQVQKSPGTWRPWPTSPSYETSVCQTRPCPVSWSPWRIWHGWRSWIWPTWKSWVMLQRRPNGQRSNTWTSQAQGWSLSRPTFSSSLNRSSRRGRWCGNALCRHCAFWTSPGLHSSAWRKTFWGSSRGAEGWPRSRLQGAASVGPCGRRSLMRMVTFFTLTGGLWAKRWASWSWPATMSRMWRSSLEAAGLSSWLEIHASASAQESYRRPSKTSSSSICATPRLPIWVTLCCWLGNLLLSHMCSLVFVVAAVTSYAFALNRSHHTFISPKFSDWIGENQGRSGPFWHKEVCNQI